MTDIGSGTRVKCIHEVTWSYGGGPAIGSVWTVSKVHRKGDFYHGFGGTYLLGFDYLSLKEWTEQTLFAAHHFAPLEGNEDLSALTGLLNKGPVDAPVRKPETVE